MTNVTLPEGMTSIREDFFTETALTGLHIPASVTHIDHQAFDFCPDFMGFTVADASVSFSAEDGVLFNDDKTEIVLYPLGKTGSSYEMPSTVESARFDYSSVFNTPKLTEITGGRSGFFSFEDGVLYNGTRTELLLSTLARTGELTIPTSVTSIAPGAFKYGNITKVTIFGTVTSIGDIGEEGRVFAKSSLIEINVLGGSSYVSDNGVLFDGTGSTLLAYPVAKSGAYYSLVAKTTVDKIGAYAFSGNRYLETLVCGSNITEIGEYAFQAAERLKTVESIDNVTDIGMYAFSQSSLESINLPKNPSFTILKRDMFSQCLNLTSIEVPSNVQELENNVFLSCTNLSEIKLNDGLLRIREQSMMNTGITRIEIPASVIFIREHAFNVCSNLREIVFLAEDPTTITIVGENHFYGVSDDAYIIVPAGKESIYEAWIPANVQSASPFPILGSVEIIIESGGHDLKFVDENGTVLDKLPGGATNKDYVILPKDDEKFEVIDVQVDGSTANKNSDDEFYVTLDGDKVIEVTVVPKKVVTFISNGNTTLQYVKNGGLAVAPSVSNPGHNLQGWFAGGVAWDFTTPVTADMTLTAQWTGIPAPKATYTVTMTSLAGVDVPPTRVGTHSVEEGGAFSFSARATSATSTLTVLVNGLELASISDNFYMIDNIRENKAITFRLTAGGSTPNPDTDPVGDDNNSGGQVIIDENTPSDIPGTLPPTGEIIVYPPVVEPGTDPSVTIDGEEVPGRWDTDEDGNPIFVIDYDNLEDGKHTLVIGDKEYTFTTDKNAGGATSNDVLSTAKVIAGYGNITIETPNAATVQVVSFSGSVVYNAKVTGTVAVNVQAGIYAVVVDGTVTKVVVR